MNAQELSRKLNRGSALSLRAACQWIADNDGPGDDLPPAELEGLVSVLLVADCWGVSPEVVAGIVWRMRAGRG